MTFEDLNWLARDRQCDGDSVGVWLLEAQCDDIVDYYSDGDSVDRILNMLRILATVDDDEMSHQAQERLQLMLAARARYRG